MKLMKKMKAGDKLLMLDETKIFHKKGENDKILCSQVPTVISLNIRRIFYIININVKELCCNWRDHRK